MTLNLLSAAQAAKRLGVKVETIYAYVSRGLLPRTLADDGRSSRFRSADVAALARRGRPRTDAKRAGAVEVSLASGVTEITATGLRYRGHDVLELARATSFEAVAELLWIGQLPDAAPRWAELAAAHPLARKLSALLPPTSPATERFAAITASLACALPLRVDLSPSRVIDHARLVICAFVHALPLLASSSPRPAARASLAQLLFPRLSPLAATPARVAALNTALVLLADHELATSTLATRVAASTRADPFAALLSGLGALSGPLHGKAAVAVQRLLREAALAPTRELAIAHALGDSTTLGFGHPVYDAGDPRARALLAALEPLSKPRTQGIVAALLQLGTSRSGQPPNVDFALGALAFTFDMPLGSSEALFAIARAAGLVAHCLEEYGEQPLRFRARALYTG